MTSSISVLIWMSHVLPLSVERHQVLTIRPSYVHIMMTSASFCCCWSWLWKKCASCILSLPLVSRMHMYGNTLMYASQKYAWHCISLCLYVPFLFSGISSAFQLIENHWVVHKYLHDQQKVAMFVKVCKSRQHILSVIYGKHGTCSL